MARSQRSPSLTNSNSARSSQSSLALEQPQESIRLVATKKASKENLSGRRRLSLSRGSETPEAGESSCSNSNGRNATVTTRRSRSRLRSGEDAPGPTVASPTTSTNTNSLSGSQRADEASRTTQAPVSSSSPSVVPVPPTSPHPERPGQMTVEAAIARLQNLVPTRRQAQIVANEVVKLAKVGAKEALTLGKEVIGMFEPDNMKYLDTITYHDEIISVPLSFRRGGNTFIEFEPGALSSRIYTAGSKARQYLASDAPAAEKAGTVLRITVKTVVAGGIVWNLRSSAVSLGK